MRKKAEQLLDVWNNTEDGTGNYKLTGPYWEVLYPILKEYAAEKLAEYERKCGEKFDFFNSEVKRLVDSGDEEENFLNAINYMNGMENSFATPQTIHQVDTADDRIIPYIPNQNIDEKDYWGREEE